ncbi:lipopolysaccharide biosynthesis protein RfbH [soil metagenome]
MSESKVFFPLAVSGWDQAEHDAMQTVIKSGAFTMGAKVAAYEKDFAKFFGSKFAVMCSSGSTANLLMVAALFYRKENPLKAGDEVIVPSVSWSTTYFPLHQYGLKLRFVDIDVETLNFDLKELEKAVSSKTRLIMAVNLLGNPNDFAAIDRICKASGYGKNITLIEDNCESMGATFDGRQCGTFGVMGTFSSFFSHHIATMEGGCVVTNDEELYQIMLCMRAHGWTRNLPKFNHVTGEKSDDAFEESFKFVLPGYNVRPLELEGALGIEQLKKLPRFVQERRANAETFKRLFAEHPWLITQKEIGASSWFGFSLVIRPEAAKAGRTRAELVKTFASNGVECRPIVAGNFAKNPVVRLMSHEIQGALPNANWIDTHGLFIGNHHQPFGEQIKRVRDLL